MMQLGFGLGLTMQQSGGGGPAYTLRQQIEGLRAGGITPCGARAGTYKVPGVDASPTGFVYNAGAGSVTIGVTFSGNLSFWDFTGLSLVNQGTIGTISDCKFGEPAGAPSGRLYYIDNYAAGSIDLIEYCTFEGPYTFGGSGTAINCRATGSGVAYAPGNIREIRYNRFLGLTSDTIKIAGSASVGGQIIKRNYFGPPVNLPNIPANYNAGTTYAANVAVKRASDGWVYLSLSAGNIGNPLPTSVVDKQAATAFWKGVDPHADFITTVAAVGNGITITENCMDHTSQPPGYGSPVASMGLTNALRVSRNSGTDHILNRVTMSSNVVFRNPSEGVSAPIQVADGSQPNFNGPIEFSGNWLAAGGGSPYFHPSSNGWVDVWDNNRDVVTEAVISGPTLRIPAVISALLMGQSQLEHLMSTGPTYRQITQPTPGNGNVTMYTQSGAGVAPVKTVVNAATVAAGSVNPSIAAMSAWLEFIAPGRKFMIGDGAVPGVGRYSLTDDSTDGADLWAWADFTSVINQIETDSGKGLDNLVECWWGSDDAYLTTFKTAFWPFYFGTDAAGASFTLGNTVNSRRVDHCLWDGTAATSAKGRGIFSRDATKWHIVTPTPFDDSPVSPAAANTYFSQAARMSEPKRQTAIDLAADTLATSVALKVGPSSHIANFEGDVHPSTTDPDGQILSMWPLAVAVARGAGVTINEPTVYGITGPTDGSYADITVDLPNGGNLTTLRALRSLSMPGTPSPHQQAVTGFETFRSATRRPVYNASETSFAAESRGTVTIVDAGSGSPRRGTVRITPTVPFAFGETISYLRGQGSAALIHPRDFTNKLYLDMLIEHVPSLYQSGALYPFEGVAVRPYQADLVVNVPAPAFTARGANFNGSTWYGSTSVSVPAGASGMASCWLRQTTTWAAGVRIFTITVGTTAVFEIYSGSAGRMTTRVNNDTGTDTISLFAAAGSTQFVADRWYHFAVTWTATSAKIYVDGVLQTTLSYASLDANGNTLTRFILGASNTGGSSAWTGDIGHLWISPTQMLDLSVSANMLKFLNGKNPVDLGGSGQTPTGTAPEWYYDGTGAAWSNKGTAGDVTLYGTLSASSDAPAIP